MAVQRPAHRRHEPRRPRPLLPAEPQQIAPVHHLPLSPQWRPGNLRTPGLDAARNVAAANAARDLSRSTITAN
eukprot:850525-Pleurochrysis_carterae.AAC.1